LNVEVLRKTNGKGNEGKVRGIIQTVIPVFVWIK
jgi:hypothetical protein